MNDGTSLARAMALLPNSIYFQHLNCRELHCNRYYVDAHCIGSTSGNADVIVVDGVTT